MTRFKLLASLLLFSLSTARANNLDHPAVNKQDSQGDTIALDRQLIVYSDSDLPDNLTLTPSSKWKVGYTLLLKLRNRDNEPIARHPGLDPCYRVSHLTIRGQHKCAGILMEGVTGSWFQGVFITDCVGLTLALQRCKETDFHSLQVTNCSIDKARPLQALVDLAWGPTPPTTKVDGTNNMRFFGGRLVNNSHLIYLNLDSPSSAGPCRKNTWHSMQFHVPPPKPYLGQPTPEHIDEQPNRVLLKLGKKAVENTFLASNFTTRDSISHQDFGRNNSLPFCTFTAIDE